MQLTGISLLIHVVVEKNENQWSKKLPRTTAPELRDSLGGHKTDQYLAENLAPSCLENPMDGGAWWAAVHGVAEGWIRLSDFPFTFPFHALEKEMATHSSVLAQRIPGAGEPGGLLSMESHRVGVRHD